MHKKFLMIAALLGALSVALGAFAAHKLKDVLAPDVLQIFETAVRYQMYHALALLATGILLLQVPSKQLAWAGNLFIAGIILFSGSLYLLCFIKQQQIDALWVGAITPLGGLCFIAGWILLAIGIGGRRPTTA
jgi:uncharacterized membrane protein YgdD (TMEM256/DUF423 family)